MNTRIEDIPTLEAAKTQIALLTVDKKNLQNGIKRIMSILKDVEILVRLNIDSSEAKHKVNIYSAKGVTIGRGFELAKDDRGDSLFSTNVVDIKCKIDLELLISGRKM